MNVKKWLTEEERGHYEMAIEIEKIPQASVGTWVDVARAALESLAAERELSETRRALLDEAKQYIQDEISGMPFDDEQAKGLENRGKKIYEAIATALKGVGE